MSNAPKKSPARRRRSLRWLVRLMTAVLLLSLGALVYLNQVGLPDFAKSLLQDELAANGLNLEFDRLRWRLERGLVAEGVRLEGTTTALQPALQAEELKIRLDRQSLFTGNPKVQSVLLRNAHLALPLDKGDSASSSRFQLQDVESKISFPSPNQWLLEHFQANCLGIQLEMQGEITNAFALKSWRLKTRPQDQPPAWPELLRQIQTIRNQLSITGDPKIQVQLYADAAAPERSTSTLSLQCEAIDSPWGQLNHLALQSTTQGTPLKKESIASSWSLTIGRLRNQTSDLQNLHLSAHLTHELATGELTAANWTLNTGRAKAKGLASESVQILGHTSKEASKDHQLESTIEMVVATSTFQGSRIDKLQLSGGVLHNGTDWRTAEWDVAAKLEGMTTPWGSARGAAVEATFNPLGQSPTLKPEDLGPWARFQDWTGEMTLSVEAITGERLVAEEWEVALQWEAPTLAIRSIRSKLYEGTLEFTGRLGVDTRELRLGGKFDFDVHRIRHLLTDKGRRWLSQYSFDGPPSVEVDATVTLPQWADPNPDWRNDVKPTLSLNGQFEVGPAAFRTVPVTRASSSISFTNMVWRLPDLTVHRPEGILHLDYRCDARTQDYAWNIDTLVDYHALAPLLSPRQREGLSLFQFNRPVETTGEIWGRWHAPELTRLKTSIRTTDFVFRGVPIKVLETDLAYVNGLTTLKDITVEKEEGMVTAEQARYNAHNGLIALAHLRSTVHTMDIARMIGPQIERSFQPYRFTEAPTIVANGVIPVHDMEKADAQFLVEGGPFSFWRFHVPSIRAEVDWMGNQVRIGSVDAPFYEGRLNGAMGLTLKRGKGAGFSLDAKIDRANLNDLFVDVFSPDTQSQGSLSGHLKIHSGQTEDWGSWQGSGHVELREGFLWDTPLFGVFSPLLNTVSPGLGNSRANSGTASFTITDSVIHTTDLVFQEPTTRLQYQGQLDFEGNLDAQIEAELLRDAPMFGKVVSLALWPVSKLFVYRVSGSLNEPIAEPVYVLPKILMNPIASIRNRRD